MTGGMQGRPEKKENLRKSGFSLKYLIYTWNTPLHSRHTGHAREAGEAAESLASIVRIVPDCRREKDFTYHATEMFVRRTTPN